jgi:hypothetical protein
METINWAIASTQNSQSREKTGLFGLATDRPLETTKALPLGPW